jgi:hypothetical protein
MKIAELFIALGLQVDDKKIEQASNTFKALRTNLLQVTLAFSGAILGLERFTAKTIDSVVSINNLSNQTGLAIDKLQKWTQAGQLLDLSLSPEQIAQGIGNLQNQLSEIRLGGGNIKPFQMLGIDIQGQDAFGVLEQVRARIKGLDSGTATNLITQLGLTPNFINLLRASRKEFEALSGNIFLSRNQQRDIMALGLSFTQLKLRMSALKDQAVAKIAPDLERLIKTFFGWLEKNGDKIINTITMFAKAFGNFIEGIGRGVGFAGQLLENLFGMENGLKAIAAAAAIVTLSFSPFIAAVLGLILLLDDIAVWKQGGKSLFGGFYDAISKLPDLKLVLGGAGLLLFLSQLANGLGSVGTALGAVSAKGGLLKKLGLAGLGLAAIELLNQKVDEMIPEDSALGKIKDYTVAAGQGAVIGGVVGGGYGAAAGAVAGIGYKAYKDITDRQQEAMQSNETKVMNNNTSNSSVNSSPVVSNNVTINVSGNSDPVTTADEVFNRFTDVQAGLNNSY